MSPSQQVRILPTVRTWWKDAARVEGSLRATRRLLGVLLEFARDSTPDRLRARFGDADYDWDFRVNTTSGAVGWRDRLLGMFHSAYQPTEPAAFHGMLDDLQRRENLDYREFTFVDLGSGKGRTLLMASDYPFRRIVGVELLPSLHEIARENVRQYKNEGQCCFVVESICGDATDFALPVEPLVLFLFNPFPELGMRRVVANLDASLAAYPRPVYVLYHNPLLEYVLGESVRLKKIAWAEQYSIYGAVTMG